MAQFLFGTQYYFAPTPERTEWAKDIKEIARIGFNTIKIWAQWRLNNPGEGKYNFDDIDELMELSSKYNLKVVINTVFDTAPAWLYHKFPDCRMVTLDGRTVGPSTEWRPAGGAPGPCYHHSKAMDHLDRFLQAVVERYRTHPSLYLWDVWCEPELCTIMRYPRLENLTCYCKYSTSLFLKWLKEEYKSLRRLNQRWKRNYQSWQEVEVPVSTYDYIDMIDWRMFFIKTVTNHLKRRVEMVRRFDQKHPVMCHILSFPAFNYITCAADEWELAKLVDMLGNTSVGIPYYDDVCLSASRGKPCIHSENHALCGFTLQRTKPVSFNDMKQHLVVPLSLGMKGFLFWTYRAELMGREAPGWGLTREDGSPTPWLEHTIKINNLFQKHADFLNEAKPPSPEVGILLIPENQIFTWCASDYLGDKEKSTTLYDSSLRGAYEAFYEQNIYTHWIHPLDILEDKIENYKILYFPFPYFFPQKIAEKLRSWIKNGGTLIAEPFFGGMNVTTGLHQKVIPGYGFDRVFQIKEGIPVSKDEIEIKLSSRLRSLKRGFTIPGSFYQVPLEEGGRATILANFPEGGAAISRSSYGRGYAYMFGSFLGISYEKSKDKRIGKLLRAIVESHTDSPYPKTLKGQNIRVGILKNKRNKYWLIIQNLETRIVRDVCFIPNLPVKKLKEAFSQESLIGKRQASGIELKIDLKPRQVKLFIDREER